MTNHLCQLEGKSLLEVGIELKLFLWKSIINRKKKKTPVTSLILAVQSQKSGALGLCKKS